ncbi:MULTISPECIES: alpha/beta hydrolase [unclassified Symbiopectobacterium]|uniref:RBBP9/YdeN family alpha/beta hydrolase n=1 Tax=unclassified Symbiopectobacterium TaxID=2794573 RepID=UPI0022274E49|nr:MULTISPECIES: alpha/beta fold hydrolase [unclassified Symbiopectobacterium]MCW2476272.1 serine hydrolase family protein [Candidatus Symbiopectobacterium sp. NZEC151]MCW2483095.1 serine hydrolase family protein [Candidatus Symbiopectobacterium sp. NZEC135]
MNKLIALLLSMAAVLSGCTSPANTQQSTARIYIVHGYGASPSEHWFAWLKSEMEKTGATVSIVNLPTTDDPQPQAWQRALETQVTSLDKNTYFVAHSLGSITLLRFLEKHPTNAPIGGYILVSGFNGSLPTLPQLDRFIKPAINYGALAQRANTRVVIAAADDTVVPYRFSQALAKSLDARFITVEQGNHFLASDGFTEFPLVLAELKKAIAASGR